MKRRVYITVTEDDIRRGQQRQHDACPIALAAQRHLLTGNIVPNVSASMSILCIGNDYGYLPPRAKAFIRAFDNGYKVKPFRFSLRVNG